jgi:peptidyl-prolyl cis-trans isomerase C
MKKLAVVFLSATLLSTPLSATENIVVGTYDGYKVTDQDVMKQFKPMIEIQPESRDKSFSQLDRKLQELLVVEYINLKLLEKEANQLGIENSTEFKEKFRMAKSQMIQRELIERHLKTAITDKMLDEEYKKLIKTLKGQREVKASHILVKTEEEAKEITDKAQGGLDTL